MRFFYCFDGKEIMPGQLNAMSDGRCINIASWTDGIFETTVHIQQPGKYIKNDVIRLPIRYFHPLARFSQVVIIPD
jgi:hypothetical protein